MGKKKDKRKGNEPEAPKTKMGQREKEESPEESDEENKADDLRIMSRVDLPKVLLERQRKIRRPRPKSYKFRGWFLERCTYNRLECLLIELLVVWLIWAILWAFLGENSLPGSYVFGIAILTSLSYLVGTTVESFTNLLPGHFLIGLGILARHTFLPELKAMGDFHPEAIDYTIRMAYIVFLLRCGLGTNLIHVKHYSAITMRLIFIPFVIVSTYIAVVTKYALSIPWNWAAMMGVMIAPSSPINAFTTSSRLREYGYSPHNEIHSVMTFSSTISTLIGLCFAVCLRNRCPKHEWWGSAFVLIIAQVIVGTVLGIIVGFVGIYVPSNNNAHSDIYRCLYFVTSSFFFVFIFNHKEYRGASFLAAYISPLVATTGWKHLNYYASVVRMRNVTTLLWSWTQPFLFALIGARIDFRTLGESRRIIFISVYFSVLLVNLGASVLSTLNSAYSWKHRLLIWFSRMPQGTVEVAISTWVLMSVKENFSHDKAELDWAKLSTDCCVLSLIITGPVGCFLLDIVGRKVLVKETQANKSESGDDEYYETDEKVNLPSDRGRVRESE